jgi:hypothetical protein
MFSIFVVPQWLAAAWLRSMADCDDTHEQLGEVRWYQTGRVLWVYCSAEGKGWLTESAMVDETHEHLGEVWLWMLFCWPGNIAVGVHSGVDAHGQAMLACATNAALLSFCFLVNYIEAVLPVMLLAG